jgi:cytochrome d ubiquinol oxidase subunit II
VATFFTGSNFLIETGNMVNTYGVENTNITYWTTPFYGLEALWNMNQWAFLTNISLGLTIAFLVRIL